MKRKYPINLASSKLDELLTETTGPGGTGGGGNSRYSGMGGARMSQPMLLFYSDFQHNDEPIRWESVLTGGATSTWDVINKGVNLNLTAASGDKIVRQTKRYMFFQPGRGQIIKNSVLIGAAKTGVCQRVGVFDDDEGIYLEQDENGIRLQLKSQLGASETVEQLDWNLDVIDGLDLSKIQTLVVEVQELKTGRIRVGFMLGGVVIYAHQFLANNLLSTPRMRMNGLPLRLELENVAATASVTNMKQIQASMYSEGGAESWEAVGSKFSASNGKNGRSLQPSTSIPTLSVRLKTIYNGAVNRKTLIPLTGQLFNDNRDTYLQAVINGTLTGASWSDVHPLSCAEFDVSATEISGGLVIYEGYGNKDAVVKTDDFKSLLFMSLNVAGNESDILTFYMANIEGAVSQIYASFQWKEIG